MVTLYRESSYTVSGNAPVGQDVILNAPGLITNQTVVANTSGRYTYDFTVPNTATLGLVSFTADTTGFDQVVSIPTVAELVLNPTVTNPNPGLFLNTNISFDQSNRARANTTIAIVTTINGQFFNFESASTNDEGDFSFSQNFSYLNAGEVATIEFTDLETNDIETRTITIPSFNPNNLSITVPDPIIKGQEFLITVAVQAGFASTWEAKDATNQPVLAGSFPQSILNSQIVTRIVDYTEDVGTYTFTADAVGHNQNSITTTVVPGIDIILTTTPGLVFRGQDHTFDLRGEPNTTVTVTGFGQSFPVAIDATGNGSLTITVPLTQAFGDETVTASQAGAGNSPTVAARVDNEADFALAINTIGTILTNSENQDIQIEGLAIPGRVVTVVIPELSINETISPDNFGVINAQINSPAWQTSGNYIATFSATGDTDVVLSGTHRPDITITSFPNLLVQGANASTVTVRGDATEVLNFSVTNLVDQTQTVTDALGFATIAIPDIPLLTEAPTVNQIVARTLDNSLSDTENLTIGVRIPITIEADSPPLAAFPNILYVGQTYSISGNAPSNGIINASSVGSTTNFSVTDDGDDTYSGTLILNNNIGTTDLSISTFGQPLITQKFFVEYPITLDDLSSPIDHDDPMVTVTGTTEPNIPVSLNFAFVNSTNTTYNTLNVTVTSDTTGDYSYVLDPTLITQDGTIDLKASNSTNFFIESIATATYINNPNTTPPINGIFIANNPNLVNNLVGYYPLDDISNNVSPDVSGNGNDLTVHPTGVTIFSQGVNGSGVALERAQLGKLFNSGINPFFGTSWTFSAWINFRILPSGNPNTQNIFGQAHIGILNSMLARFDSPTNLNVSINTSLYNTTVPTISLNTWYLLSISFDFATNEMTVYWNDNQINQITTIAIPNVTTRGLTIGALDHGNTEAIRHTDNRIDELGIWNRVLTLQEISDIYSNGNGLQYVVF